METEKNSPFLRKANFLLFKIVLWVSFGILFVSFSVVIPSHSLSTYRELIVFLFLVLVVNIHISYLYPRISRKSKWSYSIVLIGSIFICILFEMLVFYKEYHTITHSFADVKKIFFVTFVYIFIRNLVFFIFFLWLESFNQLIQFYAQKEKIYQKEMALLIEKQEFEKKFSRKKLLSHYFFNILEHLYAHSLIHYSDSALLDKVKFILYYFLVDAEKEKVELDKELEFYKYYIDLEEFRSRKNVSVNFNIFGETENFTVIPLLFEPLVGNAMKHTQRDGTGWVDIQVDATHFSVLNFRCRNNYCYRSSNIVSSENGLKILEQRLELCYKDNYVLKIEQNDELYDVLLSITVL